PLHLAAASGVPCLGLFTQTDPARYGCLGAQHLNLVIGDRNAIPLDHHWLAEALAREPQPQQLPSAPSPVPSPGLASGAFVVTL
ncbi:lipopolysaccharide heptosyltransferase family protein, partial [Aeromonas hydrophila]|nr:lipopolysaccharide heptosyltransferase family protein [Aeromonas hydrophila]